MKETQLMKNFKTLPLMLYSVKMTVRCLKMIQTVMDFFQRTQAFRMVLEVMAKMKVTLGTAMEVVPYQCSRDIIAELLKKAKMLYKLKEKDPGFSKFLGSYDMKIEQTQDDEIVTDSEILAFSICRLRASIIFLSAFPSLLGNLIKIAVHLWATGDGSLSSHAFLIIKDIASVFSSNWFDFCFVKTYKAFINHCKIVERKFEHVHFLRNSFVELCCLDMQKSSNKAMICILHLGKILQKGWQTKKKELVKTICSWQYINCIDLWVTFISANIQDYDLQPLLYMIVQIINGVALLFAGPRYLPLRLRCIQWLNHLSGSSGVFIPVTSLVLDFLEYKITKDSRKPGRVFQPMSTMKLPKHWLKSRDFQQVCVSSAIELLSEHFAQWSYHIPFPELATAPLIHLKKLFERTTTESFRRVIKRFIDQVDMNIDFVQKKREEVPFSPKDLQSVESFLQVEKRSGNTPFTQYYKSIMSKAASRKMISNRKSPGKGKKKMLPPNGKIATDS